MTIPAQLLYGRRGPWPQPSPRYPDGMPAAVTCIPLKERIELALFVVSRLRLTVATYAPAAKAYSWLHPGLEEVDDAEFGRLLGETVFSKLLNPVLDPSDRKAFRVLLARERRDKAVFYKMDFSAMQILTPLPGLHASPTVTLFRRKAAGPLEALAIRIGKLVLRPSDGDAWELAKYYVLQGATSHLVTGFHAWLHFPLDAINAITKSCLPKGHLLFRLLSPHLRFSLALNDRVLEHPRTLLNNSQKEIYTPFAGTAEGTRELISAAYCGIPGNSSYPAYRYPSRPPQIPSSYGLFLNAYYDAIHGFVEKVLRKIPKEDPFVGSWADHIARWVPGFPDKKEIRSQGRLAAAVAYFICDVSVMHAADHYSYSQQSINKLPFRLRVPPPLSRKIAPLDRSKLVNRDDIFRYKMAHQMFFKPNNLTLLHTTRYGFKEKILQRASADFLDDLKSLDASFGKARHIPLREISRSIQY